MKLTFAGTSHGIPEADRLFKGNSFELVVFEGAHARLAERREQLADINTKEMIINHLYSYRNPEEELSVLAEGLPYKFSAADDGRQIIL